ncbi:hypothetical protein EDF42_3707 [Curtobacterium sp. PhB172]|uniref:hypothetical protein n=1 Tax=Curtobacterium sp. PhB172 TaxID=2485196 RepID=UPI000F8FCD05|nr:hypothetical protein [Curtobacterium sp. PhB172]ROS58461.1 hypothetical protein EDF42_3707 [Curtobacterium sp. PhB172]
MNTVTLIGFAGSLRGNEANIVTADPVVAIKQHHYVAVGGSLAPSSLRPIANGDHQFVHLFAQEGQRRAFTPGHVVALAGPALTAEVESLAHSVRALHPMSQTLRSWSPTHRGFAWALAEPAELEDIRIRARNVVEPLLISALAERLNAEQGYADTYFRLYSALSPSEDDDYLLTRAVYFHQRHDDHALQMLIDYAPRQSKSVRTKAAFKRRIRARIARMNEERVAPQPVTVERTIPTAVDTPVQNAYMVRNPPVSDWTEPSAAARQRGLPVATRQGRSRR